MSVKDADISGLSVEKMNLEYAQNVRAHIGILQERNNTILYDSIVLKTTILQSVVQNF